MRTEWNTAIKLLLIFIGTLWLQVIAPPWLCFFGLLVWFRKTAWQWRATCMVLFGILWSISAGVSPVWGVSVLAVLFWGDQVFKGVVYDRRWRMWLVAGITSVVWSWMMSVSWSTGVFFWWAVQGGISWFLLHMSRKKYV